MVRLDKPIDIFNVLLSHMINNQKDLTQPIYAIAKFYCGKFTGITGIYSLDGDNDYEEIKNNFLENYAWKENQMGVMEQTYELIKIDICSILDYKGELV